KKIKSGFCVFKEPRGTDTIVGILNNCSELKLGVSNRIMPSRNRNDNFADNQKIARKASSESFVLEGQKICLFSLEQFTQSVNNLNEAIDGSIFSIYDMDEKGEHYLSIYNNILAKCVLYEILQLQESCIFDIMFSEFSDFSEYTKRGIYFQLTIPIAINLLDIIVSKISSRF
ncbi:MAG: hypothetical protein MHPSP_003376, partial [Paramarteilia canceri]